MIFYPYMKYGRKIKLSDNIHKISNGIVDQAKNSAAGMAQKTH